MFQILIIIVSKQYNLIEKLIYQLNIIINKKATQYNYNITKIEIIS